MNKTEFIDALAKKINYNKEDTTIINDILEENFFISKKSKDKIISILCSKFEIEEKDAEHIYDSAKEILNNEIKLKLKHPFKSKD